MAEKIKADVDRLLLVSKIKKSSILPKCIRRFVFNVMFSNIPQILETKFYAL